VDVNSVSRRNLLWAAASAPLAAVVSGTVVPAAAEPAARTADTGGSRFTIAVLPDTQYLLDDGGSDHEPVRETLRYLASWPTWVT
jgi:hypothetical protein